MIQLPVFDPAAHVFPPLASYMTVELVVNPAGQVWILHDKPLPAIVSWADYYTDTACITLAMDTGQTQELGIKVPAAMATALQDAVKVSIMLMENQTIADFTIVPLNFTL